MTENLSKASEEKLQLMEQMKKESEQRASLNQQESKARAKELEDKMHVIERVTKENTRLMSAMRELEEQVKINAKTNEEVTKQLQAKIQETNKLRAAKEKLLQQKIEQSKAQTQLQEKLAHKESEEKKKADAERARKALEKSSLTVFKLNDYGSKYKGKARTAQLQIVNCAPFELEDIFYRIVRISP